MAKVPKCKQAKFSLNYMKLPEIWKKVINKESAIFDFVISWNLRLIQIKSFNGLSNESMLLSMMNNFNGAIFPLEMSAFLMNQLEFPKTEPNATPYRLTVDGYVGQIKGGL